MITKVIAKKHDSSTIYYLDVMKDGIFANGDEIEVNEHTLDKQWRTMQEEVCDVHLYLLFLVVNRWLGNRTDLKVFEYGHSSLTVYQDLYYRCSVRDIILNLSSSRLPSAGYRLVTNPTLNLTNLTVSF